MDKLYWSKIRENAIKPTKRKEDGGYDLYACLNDDVDYIMIPPNQNVVVNVGIATAFDSGYVGFVKERGSTGIKNMAVRAGVIDSGFRNEWKVILNNTGDIPIMITDSKLFGDGSSHTMVIYPMSRAIAQVVFLELPVFEEKEIPYEELLKFDSERGLGMLGNSGK